MSIKTLSSCSYMPQPFLLDPPYSPKLRSPRSYNLCAAKQQFELGNAALFRKEFEAAISHYSYSLNRHAIADQGEWLLLSDLVSLFNLRALAYFFLNRFAESEQDARMSIEADPSNKAGYVRLFKALEKQERYIEAYDTTQRVLQIDPTCADTKACAHVLATAVSDRLLHSRDRLRKLHPIEVRMVSQSAGRGVFASKEIGKGEKIFAEYPLVCALKDRFQKMNCSYCGKWLSGDSEDSIPCSPNFCLNCYCSSTCKDRAEKEFHKHICGRNSSALVHFYNAVGETEEKTGFYPFELYAIHSIGFLIQMIEQGHRPDLAWLAIAGRFHGKPYSLICREAGMPVPIDPTPFLSSLPEGPWTQYLTRENFDLLAGIAYINCNPVTIRDTSCSDDECGDESSSSRDACGGLFPMQSVLNHSCQPNVEVVGGQDTNQIVVIALRDIKAGEELRSCYVDIDYQPPKSSQSSATSSTQISPHAKHLRDVWNIDCNCGVTV